MSADPRCPSCHEKVSATATWCMHCGVDFDEPADAEVAESAGGEVTLSAEATERTPVSEPDRSSVDRTRDGSKEIDAARGAAGSETSSWAADPLDGFTPDAGDSRSDTLLAPLFAFLDRGEWRLVSFVLAVCLGFGLLVESATTSFTGLRAVAAVALGLYMLSRVTARETVAAGATGAGLLTLGVRAYDVVRITIGDGLGAAVDLLAGSGIGLVVAVGLVLVGRYLGR